MNHLYQKITRSLFCNDLRFLFCLLRQRQFKPKQWCNDTTEAKDSINSQIAVDTGGIPYLPEYDENGNCIIDRTLRADGSLESWVEYEYDPDGLRTKLTYYDENGEVTYSETFSY